MTSKIEVLLNSIRRRYEAVTESYSDSIQEAFISHLESLTRWYDEPQDYPDVKDIPFPEKISVAYAVCHPECGVKQFIVDGGTQECQRCGSLMFRTEVKKYKLIDSD